MNKRRNFLKHLAVTGTAVLAGMKGRAMEESCTKNLVTPQQDKGPFYPVNAQTIESDVDLTTIEGATQEALGERIYVTGQVTDQNCNPVEGALVEIWQACESGRYNHSRDPNKAPLDENFQYYGKMVTDKEGKYSFKTIRPGQYPARPAQEATDLLPAVAAWIRPSHIHFKVELRGYRELITQMYFAGDDKNDQDILLNFLTSEHQEAVIVNFEEKDDRDGKVGVFDISLEKLV